ncbi:MAG: D-isomer specific 2-hydroxyacid dehydrogenase NAD-binding protein [Parcubacteria group bacterium GW2011_GWB1_50_9]|uniref:D-isomer specific 2-hydroxyacid dehydrogenase NAD-binding protein n=2 Tax=Parcubacteria group TaxID=1794811 RepID=A0A0G1WRI1_9BACT|nr:MAG: D-isomer specific 2-hydroxyacid dehydrogenase NAD-binding protein [Parcubacteria group bacterium GW2011_GWB1_50_9]KKW21396.1 MAG: D-isomer specific 2-hydroxyacid dehydrogenase NAD-binding protein [Candidatus Adlerbacteria bacterium GW2011_GWC1_50_9]
MRIAYFGVTEEEKTYLKSRIAEAGLDGNVVFSDEKLQKEDISTEMDFDIISVFVDSKIDKPVLDAFPNLKYIMARSVGYDHIDLAETKKRGIIVSNVPSYGDHTVAEFTFALILTLSRKIFLSVDRIRETGSFSIEGLRGFDLKDKTIGVVGTGKIGKKVIELARGFGMNIIAQDAFPDKKAAEALGFQYVSFDELINRSDIVTLHVPYSKDTHHLMNRDSLAKMKKGAYLINTSRGGVVETEALVGALKSGQVGGAGLDVLEEELVIKDELDFIAKGNVAEHNIKTILANHVLINLPNVVITPHNAFNSKEALERILDASVDSIKGFLEGAPPNAVSQ